MNKKTQPLQQSEPTSDDDESPSKLTLLDVPVIGWSDLHSEKGSAKER